MNLLQKRIEHNTQYDGITTSNFRQYQYNNLDSFIDIFIEYIAQQNNNYLHIIDKSIVNCSGYFGIHNSSVTDITVDVNSFEENVSSKQFFKMLIPTLLDGTMFFLNGNYYIPTLYVIDFPIVLKKKSIKLFGLFNSLTLYFKEDFAIFTGTNIPLSYFFQLILTDNDGIKLYQEFLNKYKRTHTIHTENNILNYFKGKFYNSKNRQDIISFLERLFFDRYTKSLYSCCYNLKEVNLINLIKKSLEMNLEHKIPSFVNLDYKRIVFLEILLRPLLERISKVALYASKGFKSNEIKIDQLAILKYFLTSPDKKRGRKGLSGSYLYDTVNLYSGILENKISMVSPGVENAPKEVQAIHQSHFGRVCPISIKLSGFLEKSRNILFLNSVELYNNRQYRANL